MSMSVHYLKQELTYAKESVGTQRDLTNACVQRDINWLEMASHVLVSAAAMFLYLSRAMLILP